MPASPGVASPPPLSPADPEPESLPESELLLLDESEPLSYVDPESAPLPDPELPPEPELPSPVLDSVPPSAPPSLVDPELLAVVASPPLLVPELVPDPELLALLAAGAHHDVRRDRRVVHPGLARQGAGIALDLRQERSRCPPDRRCTRGPGHSCPARRRSRRRSSRRTACRCRGRAGTGRPTRRCG